MVTLCAQSDVELLAGFLEFTVDPDPKMARLIELASAAFASAAGVSFDPVTAASKTMTGDGTDHLWLAHRPLTAVTSVTEAGITLVEDTDYVWAPSGLLVRLVGTWSVVPRQIVVVYDAGYPTVGDVPDDIGLYVAGLVTREYRKSLAAKNLATMEGLSSVTLDDRSATIADPTEQATTSGPMVLTADERRHIRQRWGRTVRSVRIR